MATYQSGVDKGVIRQEIMYLRVTNGTKSIINDEYLELLT